MTWRAGYDTLRYWRTLARLAWVELKSSRAKSLLIVITIAISIAGVGGVFSAASVAREAFQADTKTWLGGDLAVDLTDAVRDAQLAELDKRKPEGLDWTLVITTLTTASSDQSPDPVMAALKVVDPHRYPFYGSIALTPDQTLVQALRPDTVAVSKELLERFELQIGDTLRVAGQPFRVSAVIRVEPDRLSGSVGVGMRCILSKEGYAR